MPSKRIMWTCEKLAEMRAKIEDDISLAAHVEYEKQLILRIEDLEEVVRQAATSRQKLAKSWLRKLIFGAVGEVFDRIRHYKANQLLMLNDEEFAKQISSAKGRELLG